MALSRDEQFAKYARYNLAELPEWRPNAVPPEPGEVPLWSGRNPPPAIGSQVTVRMNSLGQGRVAGYFVESGYLGVYVTLVQPPAWLTKQLQGQPDKRAMVFGAELAE